MMLLFRPRLAAVGMAFGLVKDLGLLNLRLREVSSGEFDEHRAACNGSCNCGNVGGRDSRTVSAIDSGDKLRLRRWDDRALVGG